jgi:hypothetical protein
MGGTVALATTVQFPAARETKNPRPECSDRRLYEKRWKDHRLILGGAFQATTAARNLRENRMARCRAYHSRFTRLDECLRLRVPSTMASPLLQRSIAGRVAGDPWKTKTRFVPALASAMLFRPDHRRMARKRCSLTGPVTRFARGMRALSVAPVLPIPGARWRS